MQNNSVDIVLALPLIIGGVIGANYGVDLAERLKAEQLRVLLALLVIAVAIRMAISLVITPRELYALEQAPPPEVIGQTAPSK
jgi:hypothetical protein